MENALLTTDLPFPKRGGKVRDVYDLGAVLPGHLLIVATDRISAYDCVMPNGIPGKGKVLTAMSLYWFAKFARQFPNHLISAKLADYPPEVRAFAEQIDGRSMLVKRTNVVPVECVARGYLAGSAWEEYRKTGAVCGIQLPHGLGRCARLPTPIFTPATKAEAGHDENIAYEQLVASVGPAVAGELRERTLRLYTLAAEHAAARGILIADTKFEFGRLPDGSLILIDEVLTPDSSRFWPTDGYAPDREPPSFDKQFVRNYLSGVAWDKTPPAPPLPPDVVAGTLRRYEEAFERLTSAG